MTTIATMEGTVTTDTGSRWLMEGEVTVTLDGRNCPLRLILEYRYDPQDILWMRVTGHKMHDRAAGQVIRTGWQCERHCLIEEVDSEALALVMPPAGTVIHNDQWQDSWSKDSANAAAIATCLLRWMDERELVGESYDDEARANDKLEELTEGEYEERMQLLLTWAKEGAK